MAAAAAAKWDGVQMLGGASTRYLYQQDLFDDVYDRLWMVYAAEMSRGAATRFLC